MTLYVDTSAAIRSIVERGASPELEEQIGQAEVVICSRLALVESARVFHRLRAEGGMPVADLADAEREIGELWSRSEVWELTRGVCALAAERNPRHGRG